MSAPDQAPRPSPRLVAAVAAPLAVALLAAGWLLWTRGDPSRQGDFCTNATVEVTTLLRRTEEPGNLDRDQARHLQDALERTDEIDLARLQAGAPDDLAADLAAIDRLLDDHRRAVAAAEQHGEAPPAQPDELREAFTAVLAHYYLTCL